jgi:NTE family protein
MNRQNCYQLGFALSGGTLRSAAHIGVIEVLHANGIQADIVSGTSGGSVIAAAYASGLNPSLMSQLASTFPGVRLVDWSMPFKQVFKLLFTLPLYYLHVIKNPKYLLPLGLIKGVKLEKYFEKILHISPTRTPLPLIIVSTDLLQNQTVIFHSNLASDTRTAVAPLVALQELGEWIEIGKDIDESHLPEIIRASCALPGVMEPVEILNRILVDGGIRDYLPVNLLYALGAKKVIGVDLHKTEVDRPIQTFFDVITRSLDILLDQVTMYRMESYKPFILTPKIKDVSWTSFDRILACVDAGREETLKRLPEIKDYIKA